ncbi:unnamed protein product [Moneuplotes crassus]|uniref:Uncharacterized protein n=1 Tax=Euplotes crassus TaxID=5936 RepID=A0AAD1X9B5_EUPCR|nr:unnamed protein product [Moneuplotes crassus]
MRPSLTSPSTRNKANEKEKLKKIHNYDFNAGYEGDFTFEEKLASEITNDFGVSANTEMVKLLIQEFLKFVFLNQMNFEECKTEKVEYTYPMNPKGGKGTCYYSTVAPPMIDIIWRALIHHSDVYSKFCLDVFGGFLERFDPEINFKEHHRDYKRTIELMKKYKDVTNPYEYLWPDLNQAEYMFEYNHTLYIPRADIENLKKRLDKNLKNSYEISQTNLQIITKDSVKKEKKYEYTPDIPKGSVEITLINDQPKLVKNIFHQLRNTAAESPLKNTLMTRCLISSQAADHWLEEYFKYLIVKIQLKEEAHPPSIVKRVLNIHKEFTKEFREFYQLVGYPDGDWAETQDRLKEKYRATKEEYSNLFGKDPHAKIWPCDDNLFIKKYETPIHFNVLRFVACNLILKFNNEAFKDIDQIVALVKKSDETFTQLKSIKDKREKRHTLLEKEPLTEEIKEEVDPVNTKLCPLYKNGGLLVLVNPFRTRDIQDSYIKIKNKIKEKDTLEFFSDVQQEDISEFYVLKKL